MARRTVKEKVLRDTTVDNASETAVAKQPAQQRNGPRREEFLTAARRRFARHGFAGTSTRDICADLGIAHSAIYNYFRTKEEILIALEEAAMLRAQSAIDALTESYAAEPALVRLEKIVRYVSEDAMRNRDLWLVINEAERAYKPAQRRQAVVRRDRLEQPFRDTIQAAIAEGTIPPRDVQLTSYHIIVLMIGPLRWFRPGGRLGIPEIAEDIWKFIRDSLTGGVKSE